MIASSGADAGAVEHFFLRSVHEKQMHPLPLLLASSIGRRYKPIETFLELHLYANADGDYYYSVFLFFLSFFF